MSLTPHITQIFQQYTTGNARAIIFGGGLAYAVSNGYWHHTPLILLNPFAYAGYQTYISKVPIIDWCKDTLNLKNVYGPPRT